MHVKEAHQRLSLRMGRCLEHKAKAARPCQKQEKIEMCISVSAGCVSFGLSSHLKWNSAANS